MTIAGREAEIQNVAHYGGYLIFAKGQLHHLSGEGLWVDRAPQDDEVFESSEAAHAILVKHADKPAPPAAAPSSGRAVSWLDNLTDAVKRHREKPADHTADAGKMVAVGEGRELPSLFVERLMMRYSLEGDEAEEIEREALERFSHPTTTAETERLRAVEAWIRSRHNGYDPEARKAMDLKEPGSLIEAMEQLEQEHEQLFSAAVEAQVAAEAELTTLREQLAAAERERDELKSRFDRFTTVGCACGEGKCDPGDCYGCRGIMLAIMEEENTRLQAELAAVSAKGGA